MRIAVRVLGVLLMLVGIYVVFFRDPAGSLTSTVLPASAEAGSIGGDVATAAVTDVQGDAADGTTGQEDERTATADPPPPTVTVTTTSGPLVLEDSGSTSVGEESAGSSLGDVGWDADTCDLTFRGYGVEMREWGDILLPYAVGFPTSDPGQIPNCAPNTDFGGAVIAAHLAYLDAIQPELIPLFAAAGNGRDRRLADHPGPLNPDTLGYRCEPLGWQKSDTGTFLIYHLCGQSSTKVTEVPLTTAGGRWQLLYPSDGLLASWLAEAGEAYYPFVGGD